MTDAPVPPRQWAIVVAGVVIVYGLVLGYWASRHGVNADEGFYLAAGRHVFEGRRLYADVFFPQMPYLPTIEALLFNLTGVSLGAARALCVIAGALAAGLVTMLALRDERRIDVAVLVAVLYAGSGVLLNSLSIVKTYALANLALLIAFVLLTGPRAATAPRAFAAGLAAAAAIGVRLALAPAVFVFVLLAARGGWNTLAAFASGGLLASLPWLAAAWQSPDHFWFCNVTFHSLRREMVGFTAVVAQKAAVLAKWVLVPQHVLLWALVGGGLWLAPRRTWPAAACTLVLAAAYLMATPTYLEYTAQFIPFMLIAALPALTWLRQRPTWVYVALTAYLMALYPFVRDVPSDDMLSAKRAVWDLQTVDAVTRTLRSTTGTGDRVLSWWEGYPVLSGRRGYDGVGFWESNVAKKISPADAKRYHVLQRPDLESLVARREPRAVVVADGEWDYLRPALAAARYTPMHRVGSVEIYVPPSGS